MSKLDRHSVTLKVRDVQVWQPSMALALVSLAGKNTPNLLLLLLLLLIAFI